MLTRHAVRAQPMLTHRFRASKQLIIGHRPFGLVKPRGTATQTRVARGLGPSGTIFGEQGTVVFTVSGDKLKANWQAPGGTSEDPGDPKLAKGVLLFMHGFSQGPNAYYLLLKDLADQGWLVVAPEPPNSASPKQLQGDMVTCAERFRSQLYQNKLPGLKLTSDAAARNIVLLAHSVGGGLASYVAEKAAAQQQPFRAVMVLAPQASVVKPYAPAAAIDRWPAAAKASTEFAVQYGLKDLLAPPGQVVDLMTKLKGANLLKEDNVTLYKDGTHVGFQDQVVVGEEEVTLDLLPWLIPFLAALLGLVTPLGAFGDYLLRREGEWREALKAPSKKLVMMLKSTADGLGPLEDVSIAPPLYAVRQYIGLELVFVGATAALARWAAGEVDEGGWKLYALGGLTAVFAVVCLLGAMNLLEEKFVFDVQRPQSRKKAVEFMDKFFP